MKKDGKQKLISKLNAFIKKYYVNKLIKGIIYTLTLLLIFSITFSLIEHFNRFGIGVRTSLFWTYIVILLIVVTNYIAIPFLQIYKLGSRLSHEDAAKIIGNHFSEIEDRLTNALQLSNMNPENNNLINASIEEKIQKIKPIPILSAIDFKKNKKHLKWLLVPLVIILFFVLSGTEYILTDSYARIVNHSKFYESKMPFHYNFVNNELKAKQNESFKLEVEVQGSSVPKNVFLILKNNRIQMRSNKTNKYSYNFENISQDTDFQLYASGYYSDYFTIKMIPTPSIVDFEIELDYPKYISRKNEVVSNIGNIEVPEGTDITWKFKSKNTEIICMKFENEKIQKRAEDVTVFKRKMVSDGDYIVTTTNKDSGIDSLSYYAGIIYDMYPEITIENSYDSISSQYIFEGIIEDDYAVSKLEFKLEFEESDSVYAKNIDVNGLSSEVFYFSYDFESIASSQSVNYYFEVWDNDGVNGKKSTKSKIFSFIPKERKDLVSEKKTTDSKINSSLKNSIEISKSLQKDMEELNKSLIEKEKLSWNEKQKLKSLLEKGQKLKKYIKETKDKSAESIRIQKKLNTNSLEKSEKLKKLMDKVMSKDVEILVSEIEKLLKEENKEKLKKLLENLDKNNNNIERELERELELFKSLEFEQKLEESINHLLDIKDKQGELKNSTENNTKSSDSLAKDQQEILEEMKKARKDISDLKEKNELLDEKHQLPNTENDENNAEKGMSESEQFLKKGNEKKSKKKQEEALDKLNSLIEKLETVQESCSSNSNQENLESLRQILENLIKLSFNQEELINKTKIISKNSSEFIDMVRNQKKLSDDAKIIEDSLFALSKRVIEIESIVNQEITLIKNGMVSSTNELENRNTGEAIKRQQFIMTSVNNLSLLLSEMLEQMQKDLANQTPGQKQCNKPGKGKPSLSELKRAQEKLSKEMGSKKGKKSGSGNKNAQEIMELTKRQEEIRKRLEELRGEIGGVEEKKILDKILEEMEKNEIDIIKENIDAESLKRQKIIFTRLLELENAKKEQGEEERKEAIEWIIREKGYNNQLEKIKKNKQKQDELLRQAPVELTPFYKQKVNTYFKNKIIRD